MSRLFSGTPFDRPISCPKCHQAVADCRCLHLPEKKQTTGNPNRKAPRPGARELVLTPRNAIPPKDQVAKILVEKRKGNRMMTVISGLDHPANDLPALCAGLKQALGVGGSQQGRTVELQGAHAETASQWLDAQGIKNRVI